MSCRNLLLAPWQEARQNEARHLRRELSTWIDDDGMVVIRGRLTPEVGAVVQRALEAATEVLYRESARAPSGAVMAEELTSGQRRLACDTALVMMRHDGEGRVLDVGRKTRTIPPGIRRALQVRDTRCRFPSCSARRCDAHHVIHWAGGGPERR